MVFLHELCRYVRVMNKQDYCLGFIGVRPNWDRWSVSDLNPELRVMKRGFLRCKNLVFKGL